ncbi:MAG: fimbria/pilus outer membrane usher protein [Neisseria sp.]|nr:fimbria/pilus outer membrane usher protein [Neisseria sp.]
MPCFFRSLRRFPHRLLNLLGGAALLCSMEINAAPDLYAEFDSSFIRQLPGQPTVDISRFSRGNPILPGRYHVDVYVNQQWRGNTDILFITDPQRDGEARLCARKNLLDKLDLKQPVQAALNNNLDETGCLQPEHEPLNAHVTFDLATLRLDIGIAQALLQQRPRGYIDPESWSKGVNSAFIVYRLNHYRSELTHDHPFRQHHTYLNINSGINLGNWHLRHHGAYNRHGNDSWQYQPFNTYAQRDIPAWRSQLTLGDFYTDGYLFDSAPLRGAQLSSDERMLPSSLQGYAPTVRGIANSNAQVRIEQNGQEIYHTAVPPGPFEINDLYALNNGGDLTLIVTEADGSEHSSTIPYASVTQLLRPGIHRYQIAAGRLRNGNLNLYQDKVLQATWQYGLNNHLTLNSGMILSSHYRSALLGGAVNTPIGALGFDATYAQTQLLAENRRHNGQSYRLHYSRLFDATQTNLTLAAYRYSTSGYYRLAEAAEVNRLRSPHEQQDIGRSKNQLQLSVNQYLGEKRGSFYVVGSRKDYWQSLPTETEWQIGYSNSFKRLSYGIAVAQNKISGQDRWQRRYMLTLSMPLDLQGRHSLSSQISRNHNNTQLSTGISGSLGNDHALNYGISVNRDTRPAYTSWSANIAYTAPWAKFNGGYGHGSQSRQISGGIAGALVAHAGGVTLANDLGDTFAIIHAEGAAGAKVLSGQNIRIDRNGYAIVPYVSPYRYNTLGIDPQGLPLDVQLDATSNQIVPRANSSTLITLNSQAGRAALFEITLNDGRFAPLGADVLDEEKQNRGFVAQGGRVFATGLADSGSLTVRWGAATTEQCRFAYQLPSSGNVSPALRMIPITCSTDEKEVL